MRYLVRARIKPGGERSLLDAIERGTLGNGSIAEGEYLRNMQDARLCNGERVGNIEFSYRLCPDRRHLEPDPAEQAALAEIGNLRRQGHTLRGIAVTLNSRGHRTRRGTDWRLESVARVVKQHAPRPHAQRTGV